MARDSIEKVLFFVRWQLYPSILSTPAHIAFVLRGVGARTSPWQRLKLAWASLVIHLRVECGHNPAEALHIIETIIELPPSLQGVVVECGTFLGGSTAKLSRAVALTGRRLIVCDSFEGLPEVTREDHTDRKPDFTQGAYLGRLTEVKANVARYGDISPVEFRPGWFAATLPALKGTPIVCAFWDVDLRESFLDCLRALWANVVPGSRVYVHDVDRQPIVEVFTSLTWWTTELGLVPPPLVGAGTGLGRFSPLLGYVTKAPEERNSNL